MAAATISMNISVAMTTHNGASFLGEQLESIFAQTRLPDELIVCDDQSCDETVIILRDYAGRAPFPMKVIVNEERLGSTKNFEKAMSLCCGDLIALCDHDDVWRSDKLAKIVERFGSDPDLGLVFSNADLINEQGLRLAGDAWKKFKFSETRRKLLCDARGYDLLLSRYFIIGATVAFRSKFRALLLPIPTGMATFIHDRWIAVLISAVARIGFIEDKLVAYRLHPRQQIGAGRLPQPLQYIVPHRCSSDRMALTAIRDRLSESDSWKAKPDFLHAIDVRLRHIAARSALSRNPVARLKAITFEYRSGRYSRYPAGVALKDLLVGTR
jgi:glycosyltransferase involved in cell wall biosynthesis